MILIGGVFHDFDGFVETFVPILQRHKYNIETSYDLNILHALFDKQIDTVIQYTCLGGIRQEGKVAKELSADQVCSLTNWVRKGGNLLALHGATAVGENMDLQQLLGGHFISHPSPLSFDVIPMAQPHPITQKIEKFTVFDEFYIEHYLPFIEIHMIAMYNRPRDNYCKPVAPFWTIVGKKCL